MNLDTGKTADYLPPLEQTARRAHNFFRSGIGHDRPARRTQAFAEEGCRHEGSVPLFVMCSVFSDGLCPSLQREQSK